MMHLDEDGDGAAGLQLDGSLLEALHARSGVGQGHWRRRRRRLRGRGRGMGGREAGERRRDLRRKYGFVRTNWGKTGGGKPMAMAYGDKVQLFLFTRLAWCQQGFWHPSFCRKGYLWSLCCDGGNSAVLFLIVFLEERECVEKIGRVKDGLVSTFSLLHASIAEKLHLSSPITSKAS